MNNSFINWRTNKKRKVDLIRYFEIIVLAVWLIWTILVSLSAYYAIKTNEDQNEKILKNEAEINLKKDLLYRKWCSLQGGVYAPLTENTPANPYLDIPERDIETPSGKKLTLINPSYMTRMVYDISKNEEGYIGHMTSLNPIRPQNKPDDWEQNALMMFEKGANEYYSLYSENGKKYLRLMKPFITEKSCLKCHEKQGYKEGDIRGGLSVSIPIAYYAELTAQNKSSVLLRHGLIWLFINIGIFFTARFLKNKIIAYKESEQRFKLMGDSTFEGIVISIDGKITDINGQLTELTGYSKDEILGRSLLDFIPPEFHPVLIDARNSQSMSHYEIKIIRKNGSEFEAEVRPRVTKIGENIIYITAVRDITERKKKEYLLKESQSGLIMMNQNLEQIIKERTNELLESEERTKLILNNAPEAIYVLDINGKCTMVNNTFLELMKYEKADDLIGKDMHALIHHSKPDGSPLPFSECTLLKEIRTERGVHLPDEIFWKKDNTPVNVECWSIPLKKDNVVIGSVTSFIDITQRIEFEEQLKKAKEEAEKANRAKSEFLANISHEIRTPMNAILGYSQYLMDKATCNDHKQHIQSIISNGNSLLSLINDILDISRIESGSLVIHSEFTDLKKMLLDLKSVYAAKAAEKGLEFIFNMGNDFPAVISINENRIKQVLQNLLNNAVKFTETGTIKLSVIHKYTDSSCEKAEIKFSIEDTGIGIPPDQIEKIFSPFVQIDGQSNRKYGGTGLGLGLTTRLVKLLGGSIAVNSHTGKGSVFSVFFESLDVKQNSEPEQNIQPDEIISDIGESLVEEITLSPEQIREFNSIMEKYLKEWESLNKSRQMTAVKEFTENLIDISKTYGLKKLLNYSNKLLEAANSLKVIKIKSMLNEFPGIVKIVKQNIRGNK
jgi:PAS domain S-box-containing protein